MEKRMVAFSTQAKYSSSLYRGYFAFARTILCLILFFTVSECYANPSVDVPVRHWSYDAIEKLAILNLADIADIGFRPVSRIKMAYMIKSALEKASDYEMSFELGEQDYLESILYGLVDEFREELVTIGVDLVSISDSGSKRYLFGKPGLKVEKAYVTTDLKEVFFENKEGWKLKEGFNLRAKLTTWAKIANFFAASLTPGVRYSENDTDVDLEDAHIRFSHPKVNVELAAGRNSMWWGPGFHGSLLMTDNAFPMDMARFNNVRPFRLPWILRKIGRFNGQVFTSKLEEKRSVPHVYVSGWRLDYTPCDFLKFGFGHILMFGGKGVKKLGFANFWSATSLVFSAAGGGSETENHIISGDVQLFLRRIDRFIPIATGAKLYTEWGGEDEAGNTPIDLAYITGMYLTDVFNIPGFDGKIEFAKFNKIWYTHFKYRSGYTHRGNFIGHGLGGDSEEVAVTGIFNFPNEYRLSSTLAHKRRGLSNANVEIIDEVEINFGIINVLKMYNIDDAEMNIFYDLENIKNYDNTTSKRKNHILGIEIKRRF
ncbi:MAG: capsule assembly Wzi family protein [Candidatus Omnitrophota bacterium]